MVFKDIGKSVELQLNLKYTHPLGQWEPYFKGLNAGRAIASRCTSCGRTWFAPRLDCPEHGATVTWVQLSGAAQVVSVTVTQSQLPFCIESVPTAFALVALHGAENLAFARLANIPKLDLTDQTVWISRDSGQWVHPSQAACYVLSEKDRLQEPWP